MRTDPDCIFCKIVAGHIPSFKLFEDDRVLSFMDINPFNDGHCLVIVKDHAETLFEADPADLQAAIATTQRIARAVQEAMAPDGLNIVQANGPAAGQTVPHYHMHVFPRRSGDNASLSWGHTPGDMTRIKDHHARILAAIR